MINSIMEMNPDLEAEQGELGQLHATSWAYREVLDDLDDRIFHAKRVDWYKSFEAEKEIAEEAAECEEGKVKFEDAMAESEREEEERKKKWKEQNEKWLWLAKD